MRWFYVSVAVVLATVSAWAQVPRVLSYQGILTDRDGRILPDGDYELQIRLYDRLDATVPIYSERQRVSSQHGVVNVLIGMVEPLPERLTFDRVYYVGVSVNGSEELQPRTMLTAVPYALRAESAATAWALTGNSRTNPAVNFLGTTDAQPLVIRTNNTERMRVTATGNVGIGTTSPTERFQVHDGNIALTSSGAPRQVQLYASGSVYTALQASGSQSTTITYTLPASLTPTSTVEAGILQTDASGNLSWVNPSALAAATAWALKGNNITSAWNGSSGNFLGTTNAQPLVIRVNSTQTFQFNTNLSLQRDAGGNARGQEAVDLQSARTAAAQVASGNYSVIGGGQYNTASAQYATVGGGSGNTASGYYATVGGGQENTANGSYSVVPGGYSNTANGDYNLVFGQNVDPSVTETHRVYFFGDGSGPPLDPNPSGFLVINRLDGDHPIHVGTNGTNGNGAHLTNAGVWTNGSSRSFKERFVQYRPAEVLEKILQLPVEGYFYKGTQEYHITPMAEDFYRLFGTGVHEIIETDSTGQLVRRPNPDVDKYLAASDVAGVALLGVQALHEENAQLRQRVFDMRAENAQLRQRVSDLETENTQLRQQISDIRTENTQLRQRVSDIRTENAALRARLERLETFMQRIASTQTDP